MYTPQISTKHAVARWSLGDGRYTAGLFDGLVSPGMVKYLYVLAVFDDATEEPVLFVASELDTELGTDTVVGPPFLGVFSGETHENHGQSEDWNDLDLFAMKALKVAAGRLGGEVPSLFDEPIA